MISTNFPNYLTLNPKLFNGTSKNQHQKSVYDSKHKHFHFSSWNPGSNKAGSWHPCKQSLTIFWWAATQCRNPAKSTPIKQHRVERHFCHHGTTNPGSSNYVRWQQKVYARIWAPHRGGESSISLQSWNFQKKHFLGERHLMSTSQKNQTVGT